MLLSVRVSLLILNRAVHHTHTHHISVETYEMLFRGILTVKGPPSPITVT